MRAAPGRRLAVLVLLGMLVCSSAASEGDAAAGLLALRVQQSGGEIRALGAVLGQAPAVVSFWATYCAPCRAEVPVLNRAARRWRDQGVRVVGVAIDVRDTAATRTADDWGIAYETYWTGGDQADSAKRLLPEGLPATFFTTPQGTHRVDRFLTDEALDRLAAEHLGIRPPAP